MTEDEDKQQSVQEQAMPENPEDREESVEPTCPFREDGLCDTACQLYIEYEDDAGECSITSLARSIIEFSTYGNAVMAEILKAQQAMQQAVDDQRQ